MDFPLAFAILIIGAVFGWLIATACFSDRMTLSAGYPEDDEADVERRARRMQ